MNKIMPIIMVVIANTIYNLGQNATPDRQNPFASIIISYITAVIISTFLLFASSGGISALDSLKDIDLSRIIVGIGVVLLDFGFILAYRTGWKIGNCSLVANIILAIVLFIIGVIFYNDELSLKRVAGLLICILGLFLVA